MSDNIEEIAAALEQAATPTDDTATEDVEQDTASVDDDAADDADGTELDAADDTVDEDEDDSDPEDVAEEEPTGDAKRLKDTQRKVTEQAEEIKRLTAQIEGRQQPEPQHDAPENVGALTLEAVKGVLADSPQNAVDAYEEALERPDVFEAVPLVIAATESFDPALAEKMRLDYVQQTQAMQAQHSQAMHAHVTETAQQATSAFFEQHEDEKEHAAELAAVLDANPVMQQWYESGDPAQVSFALDMARHVRRSTALDAYAGKPKVDPAADEQAKRDRAAARGLDTGKGGKRPKADPKAGADAEAAKGLMDALTFIGAA